MSIRLLLVLPQWPRDPASGAARSLSTIARLLARNGITVQALATTATEGSRNFNIPQELAEAGIASSVRRGKTGFRNRPELSYDDHSVPHRLLDVANRKAFAWEETLGREFDLMFDEELASFKPDVMLTFGGTAGDIRRRQRARRQGIRVIFGLRNNGYLDAHPEFWKSIDEILTPSRFLTDLYRTRQHIESTPIPSPFDINDVIAEERDPIFFTMVNPSPEKGLMLFVRLAEECSKRRPDIPFLVVESRGSGGMLVRAGLAAGFDLRRHENIMLSSAVPQPKDIYVAAKAILSPSFCQEPFSRVAAEAMLNGIPPLCSNRGGMAEICSDAGFVFHVPPEYTEHTPHPVPAEVVTPWIQLIERLEDDPAYLAAESLKAKQAGQRYHPDVLIQRYLDFFAKL